jgi:hypothetical protein
MNQAATNARHAFKFATDESVQLANPELRKPVAASHAHIDDADVALATIQKLIDKPTGGGKCCPAATPFWDPFARSSLRRSDNYPRNQRVELTRGSKFKLNLLPIGGYCQIKCLSVKRIWTYFCCSHNYTLRYHSSKYAINLQVN